MGQRHQIFLKVINPTKQRWGKQEDKERMSKIFGDREFSILAFHNQWMYGRTALQHALNILIHTSQFDINNIESYEGYHTPFCKRGIEYHFQSFDNYIRAIEFILNYNQKHTTFNYAGIGSCWFLNETDGVVQDDFTLGDNNDGITIIDTFNSKYCFMNIYSQNVDGLDFSATDLPELTPVSAHDYVKAYYGETIETCNPYYFESQPKRKKENIIKENIRDNNKLVKQFSEFGILSIDELKEMFPQMINRL